MKQLARGVKPSPGRARRATLSQRERAGSVPGRGGAAPVHPEFTNHKSEITNSTATVED